MELRWKDGITAWGMLYDERKTVACLAYDSRCTKCKVLYRLIIIKVCHDSFARNNPGSVNRFWKPKSVQCNHLVHVDMSANHEDFLPFLLPPPSHPSAPYRTPRFPEEKKEEEKVMIRTRVASTYSC